MENIKIIKNQYGQVDCRYGVPDGFDIVPEKFLKIKKNKEYIKENGVEVLDGFFGFYKINGFYKPDIRKITEKKHINILEKNYKNFIDEKLKKEKSKKEKIKKELKENEINLVAQALYVINKKAKKIRNQNLSISERWFFNEIEDEEEDDEFLERFPEQYEIPKIVLYTLRKNKEKKERIYRLKEEVLDKIIQKYQVKPLGYHRFEDKKRLYYEFGGFGFHSDVDFNENIFDDLGSIDDLISSDKKIKMSEKRALEILENFLGKN